jgi:6,7-dimethyl-8-ribityllumazine synthase
MGAIFEGQLGSGGRFALVVSRFNSLFSQQLLAGCQDALRRHGVQESDIDVAWVPGAVEIPLVAQRLAESGRYDAIIALGCVVRGATPHFEHVAHMVSRGCAQVALELGVPVIFGVLTTDNLEQAMERAGTKAGNKGHDAALQALEMVDLLRRLPEETA